MTSFWKTIWTQVCHDLRPNQERIDLSWRIALICAMMVCVAMIYKIPFVAVSLFVIFFVMRSDSAESNILAAALIVLATIVVGLLLLIIEITLPSPAIRLAVLLVTSYFLLFFGVSTQLGPLGGIIALVITFVLSMLNYVEVPEIAVRGTLYAWLMAATPMGIVLLANWFWGRRPKAVLYFELTQRLKCCAALVQCEHELDSVRGFIAQGIEAQQKRISWLKLFYLAPKAEIKWVEHATLQIYRLMLAILAWQRSGALQLGAYEDFNRWLAQQLTLAAQALSKGEVPAIETSIPKGFLPANVNAEQQNYLAEIESTLAALCQDKELSRIEAEKEPLAQPDIWTNPSYKHHAIKGTAAATICYMLYSIADWQGIHTAMITCYVASLGTTAETLHKLTLRIIGCLIGAFLGMLCLLFLMVHINDIGSLLFVVFVVSWVSAWVFTGPERISYAGIQIAFAFYLVLLHGFGPSYDFDAAWDRIVGVLMGNIMMYLFFTRLWPVGQQPFIETNLQQAQQLLEQLSDAASLSVEQRVQLYARAAVKLEAARNGLEMTLFELKNIRPKPAMKQELERRLSRLRMQLEEPLSAQ